MALFDPTTGMYNEASFALDTHAAIADEPSIFESLGNVVTKGIPLTGLAIVNSFANTAIDIGNVFGGDFKRVTIEDEVGDGELLDYYKGHETGIETAGFVIGSLIPGLTAVKALKLAQAGRMSAPLQRATNIFAGPKQRIVEGAIKEIEAGDAALYGSLNADKFKAIALGVGDQALQALAYETATAATMKASPLIDKDSLQDTLSNIFYGTIIGGGIGGVVEGIFTRAIINKALVNADTLTKAQEISERLGRGGYVAGDRVAVILASLDEIPAGGGILGTKKAAATRDAAILDAKKMLGQLVDKGDEEVSNALFDTMLKMKEDVGMPKEQIYNYFARLAKVSRVETEPSIPTGDIFYVNRLAKGDTDITKLFTNIPEETADVSLAYVMRKFATEVKIGRFDQTIEIPNSSRTAVKYATAKEAFQDGNDIFIGKDKRIYINPDAPNLARVARPGESRALSPKEERLYRSTGKLPEKSPSLYGAPLTLNTLTGDLSTSVVPVVGDFGKPKLFDKGLQFGDKTSLQSFDKPITKETSTLDANARYVWMKERGILRGDEIDPVDIPALEELYRSAMASKKSFVNFMEEKAKQKVSFSDESDLPFNPDDLLNRIRAAKDNLITELLDDPKLSSAEVALRANVPESYLSNGLKAKEPKEYMLDTELHSKVNHVQMEYDLGAIHTQDGQILRGMIDVSYRVQLIKDTLEATTAKFFGSDYEKFIARGTAADATIEGVGAKLFSASNAKYGTLGQEMERIGRVVTDWNNKRMSVVSERLASHANNIRNDPQASAELGNFIAVRRRTAEQFIEMPEDLRIKAGFNPTEAGGAVVVLKRSLVKDRSGAVTWDRDLVPEGFLSGVDRAISPADKAGLHTVYFLNKKVADFERANREINNSRMMARNEWYASQGMTRYVDPGVLFAPSIDTKKYPYFALVKAREGAGLNDDGTAIITAETAADLEQKIASLKDGWSVYTKDLLKKHHEVLGDYEYDRNFAQSSVNSELQRRGILNNIFPDTRAESIIKDYIDWHSKQELRLTRDYVELGNAQLFAELRSMGERFTSAETSRTGFVPASFGRTVSNPYNSYIKTALGVSEKDEYRLWADANEKVEAFFDTAFKTAKNSFMSAQKGIIPYEEAASVSERFGLGNPYGAAIDAAKTYTDVANKLPPERHLSKFVGTANAILAATAIRLDYFQSLINAVSTPVLLTAEANSAKKGMAELLSTTLPDGSGRQIPATSKLLYNSVANYFNADVRAKYMPIYKGIGAVRDKSSEYFKMIDELTLPYGKFSESALKSKITNATDLAAKLTGSELSEEFGRFIAADTARQIFETAGYSGLELTDNISTFVNRVHGNYVASQRPVAFQGPIGQAIGLFQTYQFNLLQQLFRYVENREVKTIASLAGIQTTLFGFQGLPGFQAINNHILGNAAGNPAHQDIYSTVPNLFDKQLGDYLLYGVLSNWMHTGLYSRGDINPRQITVLPTNPLDYPAIAGGIRFVGELLDTSAKIANGGSIPASLMLGLEHNGLSRPLSGLAQLVQGYSTTSGGKLVASTRPGFSDNNAGWNDYINIANFSRLLGARPLDEAVAMDLQYRSTLYKAKDNTRIEALGEAVKTKMYAGGQLSPVDITDFAHQYAASGGNISKFGSKIIDWTKDANTSVANQVYLHLANPRNQQAMETMGGHRLPDFSGANVQPQ